MERIFICHSGGCPGADMEWEQEGEKYGVKTVAYSFYNHIQKGKYPKVLTVDELREGFEHVMIANQTLKRSPETQSTYAKNLLSRNWFQVKNSDAIFAIGKFSNQGKVEGGTGWAVQMAIDSKKEIFVFNQIQNIWSKFNHTQSKFDNILYVPTLTPNFAGIGTRDINYNGIKAIKDIYKHNFSLP